MALLTQCSGKERVSWEERSALVGAAALAAGQHPHAEHREAKARCPTRHGNGLTQIRNAALRNLSATDIRIAWKRGALGRELPVADGWCTNRTVMCLVSVCAMINATQSDLDRIEHVSLVDEDTPQHILNMLSHLGVRLIDMSHAVFPTYFNNVSRDPLAPALPQPLAKGATVAEALKAGHSHYSYAPNCWSKLWVWNLTEYEKILWYDPDVLAVGNAYRNILHPTPAFSCLSYPKSRYLNTGVMVIEPSREIFRQLMGIWHAGDYPFMRGKLGDDDQHFFQDVIYGHRVSGLRLHPLSPCHNDKSGRAKGCDPEKATVFHKTPLWEAGREYALWQAARAGKCAGNAELMSWDYSKRSGEWVS